jgi:3-oxoacyl-[acyl-carrier-protein] synthase-1
MSAVLTGVAALSPVGDDAASTFAALRASIAGLAEHPFHELTPPDPDWDEPEILRAGLVPSVDPEVEGPARLAALARGALQALARDASLTRDELAGSALFAALPENGPDVAPWDLGGRFVDDLLASSGLARFVAVGVDQTGHTGALVALFGAMRCLAERRAPRCVVLAVDSYIDEQRLADWDGRRRRLRSSRSRDGFLPGECAVALLIEPAADPARRIPPPSRPAHAWIAVPAFGQEPHPIEGDRAPVGIGVTDAVRRALAGGGASPRVVYSDQNGESHRAFEWGLARTRVSPLLDDAPLHHPADCIGDVGAASGALLVGLAAHALARAADGGASGPALVLTSATSGHRAAVVVSEGPCPPP